MGSVAAQPPMAAHPMSTAPSWLVAYRQGHQRPQAPAKPLPRPVPTPARRQPKALPERRTDPQGFSEPLPWPDDNGVRREAVLDTDCMPPRVIRRVGWLRCLRCRRSFFSEDVTRMRLCGGQYGCRNDDERHVSGGAPVD